jgi:hypothetical protein
VLQNAGQFQDPPHEPGRMADEQNPSDPVGGGVAGDDDADRRTVQEGHRAQADLDVAVTAPAGQAGDCGVQHLAEFRHHRQVDLAPQCEEDPPWPFLERAGVFHDYATWDSGFGALTSSADHRRGLGRSTVIRITTIYAEMMAYQAVIRWTPFGVTSPGDGDGIMPI